MMLGIGMLEALKGIGKIFLNPLLYWIIILLFIISWRRIRKERRQFGTKVYPLLTELKGTLWVTIIFGILLSAASILLGFMMSIEMLTLLVLVTIVVSLIGGATFLSASYTFGITFILLLFLPNIEVGSYYFHFGDTTVLHLLNLVLFMVIILFAETILISTKKGATFPELAFGARGLWIGQHRMKRLAFIPFMTLIPVQDPALALPIFPYIQYADTGFSLIFIPFIIGTNYTVRSMSPINAGRKLGQANWLLAVIVLLVVIVSMYLPYVSIIAIIVAIIGKEWIMYRHKRADKNQQAIYVPLNQGVRVLATIPHSPADRLGIEIGETITKVNGHPIHTAAQFYESLQNSGAFFKLDVIDHQGEVRFIHSALYEEDHHELGIVFVNQPSESIS